MRAVENYPRRDAQGDCQRDTDREGGTLGQRRSGRQLRWRNFVMGVEATWCAGKATFSASAPGTIRTTTRKSGHNPGGTSVRVR